MENFKINQSDSYLAALYQLVATLRGKDGCPWDKKQTPHSVSVYLIEEVFELAEAIVMGDPGEIREELGDVLFHIVFIARMFQEAGQFDLKDVAEAITTKMIRRHPHVFGDRTVSDSEEVVQNWHKIKLEEKKASDGSSLLDSIPAGLPSLMRAYRVSDRAAKGGVEWNEIVAEFQTPDQLRRNLKAALQQPDEEMRSEAFGDLLFGLVNICRQSKIHPETALLAAVHRFEQKVKKMQDWIAEREQGLEELSAAQKSQIWKKINES